MVDNTIIDMDHSDTNLHINIILMDFIRNTDMAVKTIALNMVVNMVPDKYFGVGHMEHQMDFVVVNIDIIQEVFMGVLSYIKVLYKAKDHFRNTDLVIDLVDISIIDIVAVEAEVKLAIINIISKFSKVVEAIIILDHNKDLIPVFVVVMIFFFMEDIKQITVILNNFITNSLDIIKVNYFNSNNKDLEDGSSFIIFSPYFLIEILRHLLYFGVIIFFQISYPIS